MNVICWSTTRLTGSILLLAACCTTVQAMSADELVREKQRLQSQAGQEPAVRFAPTVPGQVLTPLQDQLLAQGFTTQEALKQAFDAEWQYQATLRSATPFVSTVSDVDPDTGEHARLKALAHAEWEAHRPDVSGRDVPSNDLCGNALWITDGTYAYSTIEAGRELGVLNCQSWTSGNAPDIWYHYVASCTGTVTFSLCDSDYDSNLRAWDACGGTTLACNDDFCGNFAAQLSLPVVAGEDYLIQVSGFNGQYGSGNMVVTTACTAPANESCATAIPVGVGRTPFYTLPGAPDATVTCGFNGSADVWYVWTPGCDGQATFSTCGDANFDTILAIRAACGGPLLACNDDDCGLQSRITLPVTGGTAYYIQVLGYNGQYGYGGLTIDANITNDACAGATPITGPGSWAYCTRDADNELVNGCQVLASGDLWYLYTADCASLVTFTTCGGSSNYDTAIALFETCGGNQLDCNDDYFNGISYPCGANSRIDRYMLQGEQVWVQMTGYYGSEGSSTLTVNTTCYNPPNDMCQLALPLPEGTTTFTTVGATTDGPVEATVCTSFGDSTVSADIWYTYTPDVSGLATLGL